MLKTILCLAIFFNIFTILPGNIDCSPVGFRYNQYVINTETMFAKAILSNIIVSQDNMRTFETVSEAVNCIHDYCSTGLYNGEPIRIRVMPETYPEDINLSPLAAYPISSFTLEGIGEAIIEGGITLDCSAGSSMPEAEYFIKDLEITNATNGIVFIADPNSSLCLMQPMILSLITCSSTISLQTMEARRYIWKMLAVALKALHLLYLKTIRFTTIYQNTQGM